MRLRHSIGLLVLLAANSLAAQRNACDLASMQPRPQEATSDESSPELGTKTDSKHIVAKLARELIVLDLNTLSFSKICDKLELSSSARAAADEAYAAYRVRQGAIEKDLTLRLQSAGQQFARLSMLSRAERNADTSALLEIAACGRAAFAAAKPAMISALSDLESSLQSSIDVESHGQLGDEIRAWRRSIMLNRGADHSRGMLDLAAHADLLTLAESCAAMHTSCRGWFVLSEQHPLPKSAVSNEARVVVATLLAHYTGESDALLHARFWSDLEDHDRARVAKISGDLEGHSRLWNRISHRFVELWRVNERVALAVADVMESNGDHASAVLWRTHFFASYFPYTYAAKSADLMHEWLMSSAVLALSERAAAQAAYATHVQQREDGRASLRRIMIAEVAQNATAHANVLTQRMSGELEADREVLTRLRTLNDAFVASQRRVVGADMLQAFDDAVAASKRCVVKGERIEF